MQGVGSIRWMPEATIVASVVLIRALGAAWQLRPGAAWSLRTTALAVVLANVAAPALTTQTPGRGDEAWRYPDAALAFAREHGLGPRVHNAFVYGGHVLFHGWPTLRPMVDGRNDMVYPLDFYLASVGAQSDPAQFAVHEAQYRSDWVLADNTPGRQSHGHLRGNPAWMMVQVTEPAVVWVRRAEHPALEARALQWLDPYAPVASLMRAMQAAVEDPAVADRLERELQQWLADEPLGLRIHTLLVLYFHQRGPQFVAQRDASLAVLDAVWSEHPTVEQLRTQLGLVH